jgi:hypothetical protein
MNIDSGAIGQAFTHYGELMFTGCRVEFTSCSVVDRLTGGGCTSAERGTGRSVVVVLCEHCGARYETELPVRAIERIRRCSRCGCAALATVPEGDEEPAPEPDER